jgi:hypothetical protein
MKSRKIFNMLYWIVRIRYIDYSAIDFRQDHIAARNLLAGDSIYADTVNKNNHPPFAAFIAVPLAYFTYPQAITIWSLLTTVGFFAIGYMVITELKIKLPPQWYLILIGLSMCWYPFYGHIAIGQLSIVICVCAVAAWVQLRRGHDFTGGMLLGLACLVKMYPGLLVVYLILRRKWRAVWGVLACMLIGMLMIVVFIQPHDLWLYATQVIPTDAKEWANFPINFSIFGFFGKLFQDSVWIKPILNNPELASTLSILTSIVFFVFIVYYLAHIPHTPLGDDIAYAVTSLVMLILSPVIWFHALLLLPLQFGLLIYDPEERKNKRIMLLCIIAFVLVSIPDVDTANVLMEIYAPYRMPWYASMLLLTPVAGIFLLWYLLHNRLKRSRIQPSS